MSALKQTFLLVAFLNGEFIPFKDANISIATQALHYGTAAFGGLRGVFDKQKSEMLLFRLDLHSQRLAQSSRLLHTEFTPEFISQKIIELIEHNKPQTNIYIRPLVYVSHLGIAPNLKDVDTDFLVYGIEMGDYFGEEVRCCFSSWCRQEDRSFPLRAKISGGYITTALSKEEAQSRGFDEAILLNTQGKIAEASAMNIFLVRNNVLITPSVNQDILEGITRRSVLEITQSLGMRTEERAVDKSELLVADEVFLTGTAAKITSVSQIESYQLSTQKPVANLLKEKLTAITNGLDPNYENWITRVGV